MKFFYKSNTFDVENLSIYDDQLVKLSYPIFETRKKFFENFHPVFLKHYDSISQNKEIISISYQSQLESESPENLLKNSIQKDRIIQFTSCGIHKDDLIMEINNHPIKKFGSQGQQKSFLIALKLAQFDFIKQQSGVPPILLLDDIFDKLDENRVAQIIKMVDDTHFGQIFISDTHPERTENVVKQIHQSYKIIKL